MKKLIFILLISFLWSCKDKSELLTFESPSGNLKVLVTTNENKVFYQLISQNGNEETVIIQPSPLGLIRSDGNFTDNLTLKEVFNVQDLSDSYTMVAGKQKELSWTARESGVALKNNSEQELHIIFRLFDEGLAFRYIFPGQPGQPVTVESEATGFSVPEEIDGWISTYQEATPWGNPGYEDDILPVKSGTPSPKKVGWIFPLLFHTGNHWIFISETGLMPDYCATHLNQDCSGGLYTIALPEANERLGDGEVFPSSSLPWEMPWRFIQVSQSLHAVVESSLVHHLAEPSKIEDTSWIKPGRASWEWWSSRGGRTVKNLKHFVDLAAEMNWEYSLVDAGWENMPDGKIEDVVDYAREKNVGLLFWYNSAGRRDSSELNEDFVMFGDESRAREMERIAAMGVKGIKVDFFATDKQMAIELYHNILKDAAKNHLVVNFHGCTLPRGWSRTYPNLLAMEAVRGAECYRFAADYPDIAAHYNTLAAVTRAVVGPTDFTPATFSNQRFPHKTTYAHELALTLVYETGLLHLADTPESYYSLPEEAINFLKEVPVTWDETKMLEAIPGELFVIARRNGNIWYIAGINGKDETRKVQVKLPADMHNTILMGDGKELNEMIIQKFDNSINTVTVSMEPHGGFVLY